MLIFGAIPPPRNFAIIRTRGGRGLPPIQPKDSIPPLGSRRNAADAGRQGRGGSPFPGRGGRHWTVERDGSVTDPSAEVVSPVCRYEDIEMVQEVVRAIRAAGAKADGSCGIHIHIGLGEHTPQSLRRLVNIVNAKEDLLTMALGITPDRRERWCRPVEQRFLTELNRRKPATMDEFARIWYRQSGGASSD